MFGKKLRYSSAVLFLCALQGPVQGEFALPNPYAIEYGLEGTAVALTSDLLLTGAPNNFELVPGSMFIYSKRLSGDWVAQRHIPAASSSEETATSSAGNFASAIDVDSILAVAGAPTELVLDNESAGAVYLFARDSSTFNFYQKIRNPTPGGRSFGHHVSISNDYLAVTGNGAVLIYHQNSSDERFYLESTINLPDMGRGTPSFRPIALEGNTLVVGLPSDSEDQINKGAVHVYRRSGTAWTLHSRLIPADGVACRGFGSSVDISAGKIIVGAPTGVGIAHHGVPCVWSDRGQVYVYRHNNDEDEWDLEFQVGEVVPAGGVASGYKFARHSAIHNNLFVTSGGSFRREMHSTSGHAYVYRYNESIGTWLSLPVLTQEDAYWYSRTTSLALNDDCVAIGNSRVASTGAAYIHCDLSDGYVIGGGIEIDIVCCRIPPIDYGPGPYTFELNLAARGHLQYESIKIHVELTSPDGVVRKIFAESAEIQSKGEKLQLEGTFELDHKDQKGTSKLSVYVKAPDGTTNVKHIRLHQ